MQDTQLPYELQEPFFRLIQHEMTIEDFEGWLYNTVELEKLLGERYYDLIALDFKDSKIVEAIRQIADPFLTYSNYEAIIVNRLLDKVILLEDDYPDVLKQIYEINWPLLDTLQNLTYSLTFEVGVYYDKEWVNYSNEKRKEIVRDFYDRIVEECKRIKTEVSNGVLGGDLLRSGKLQ